jgi:endo-1,4-beta-D-glucanase Y
MAVRGRKNNKEDRMKKIWTMVAIMIVGGAFVANAGPAWASWAGKFEIKSVQLENGALTMNATRVDVTPAEGNIYITYAGAQATDPTVINRLYAIGLTAIASGQLIEAKYHSFEWGNTYYVTGMRVTDQTP